LRKPEPKPDWPASWKTAYAFDLLEVFDEPHRHPGYANAYAQRRERTLSLVRQVAAPGARVLDVAAAQGNFSLALAEQGYHVTWNDLREELIGYVKLKHERGALEIKPGQILELPPSEPLYDVVVATEVLEHVAHPDRFLAKLSAFLKPGGHLVMTTPNGRYVRNRLPKFSDFPDPSVFEKDQFKPDADGHLFLLYPEEIRRFAKSAGLSVETLSVFTHFVTAGWLGTAPLTNRLPPKLISLGEAVTGWLPAPLRERVCISMAFVLRRG